MKIHRGFIVICIILLIGFIVFMREMLHPLSYRNSSALCWKCNVVIIAIDLLRADSLPCYGYRFDTAPNLCAYSNNNIQFSRAYATSSWTQPSEASLFTGLYLHSHGMSASMRTMLNPQVATLPKILYAHGYETIAVSNIQPNVGLEMGLGKGFTSVRLIPDTPNDSVRGLLGAIDAIQNANNHRRPAFVFYHTDTVRDYLNDISDPPSSFSFDPVYHSPALPKNIYEFTEHTWTVMRDHLLYIINVDTLRDKDRTYSKLYDKLQNAKTLADARKVYDALPASEQGEIIWESGQATVRTTLGNRYAPFVRHLYDDSVRTIDDALRPAIEKLSQRALSRRTVVIITSEHGEYLGERGIFGHTQPLFEPETHVPLIMHIPKISKARVETLASLIDIYHTVFDLIGVRTAIPKSSISQIPAILHDTREPGRTFVISEWAHTHRDESIRTNEWHFMMRWTSNIMTEELYDLSTDPTETKNVASTHPSVVKSLKETLYLTLGLEPVYTPINLSFPNWIDEAHRKKLIETGYY